MFQNFLNIEAFGFDQRCLEVPETQLAYTCVYVNIKAKSLSIYFGIKNDICTSDFRRLQTPLHMYLDTVRHLWSVFRHFCVQTPTVQTLLSPDTYCTHFCVQNTYYMDTFWKLVPQTPLYFRHLFVWTAL